jgi:4-hydroxy-tetrahydrodipicolinate synthase
MFSGSMVALVTPMMSDGAVDFAALDRLVEFQIANGTDAIVSVGTTGESATLTVEEHIGVIERTLKTTAGRVPIIAGTGANSTREAIELTRLAHAAGVQGCLLVTPYYNRPTQEGLYRHYKAVADAVPTPIILYNVPGRTACDMKPETVQRLSALENIVGLKEASGSLERNRELIERVGTKIKLLSGDDDIACESMLSGFHGVISVTANVAPKLMHDMCVAAAVKDRVKATAIDAKLRPLHKMLFCEPNPIPVKWVLARMGFMADGIRLPLTPASDEFKPPLLDAMRAAGIAFA